MTGVLPPFAAAPFTQNPWKLFRNTTAETIPAFAVMRITGSEDFNGAIRFTVAKPNATQYAVYLVNGPYAVPAGTDGVCTTLTQAGYVAYDDGDGAPALGESWGAKNAQWTAAKDVPGFFICGGVKLTGNVNVVAAIQVAAGSDLIQFATTEYMGESTAGEVAGTFEWGGPVGDPVDLRDEIGQFPDIHSGAKGTAVHDEENSYYRIISSQRTAIYAYATISESLCPDADPAPTTVSISGFTVLPVGDYVGAPPTTPTVVDIGTIHAGSNGDKVLLRRINNDLPDPTWEIIAIDKHVLNPVINVSWDGTILQQTKRKIWVEICDTTETDSTIDTPEAC